MQVVFNMKVLSIKNCEIGTGIPKICVPIVGRSTEEVLTQAEYIRDMAESLERQGSGRCAADIIEFRADYYDYVTDGVRLNEILEKLKDIFSDRLLLFTYRSEDEGGELRHDRAENMIDDIYDRVIAGALVDLIDVELFSGNYRVARMCAKAHDKGIKVILSSHDFKNTPRDDVILERFENMEILGGDILKFAAMPKNEFDVRRLMELTRTAVDKKVNHPVVTMSMSEIGKVSRFMGEKTGSAITFAKGGQESAPGQPELKELYYELERIHKELNGGE